MLLVLGLLGLGGVALGAAPGQVPIGTQVNVGANPSAVTIDRGGRVVYVTAAQINGRRGAPGRS